MDWKKRIMDETFDRPPTKVKTKPVYLPPVEIVKIQQVDTKAIEKNVLDKILKEIKDKKMLDVSDLRNSQSIIYPNKRVQDLRFHGAGVTKIIAGTNISISNTGEVPGLSDVTINSTGGVATNLVDNETPTGLVNGVNTVFTTAFSFSTGTTHLYRNGLRQQLGGGNDYTETAANQITFVSAPLLGDILIIDYQKP